MSHNIHLVISITAGSGGNKRMQQVQTREFETSSAAGAYAWRSDEEVLINTLMGAAWDHHVARRTRLKLFLLGLFTGARPLGYRGTRRI